MTYKLLVVCGTGMGSSMILKMMVDKAVASRDLPFSVTSDVASAARSSGADVLVAGLDLAPTLEGLPIPVIGIKNILDTDEIGDRLEEFVGSEAASDS